MKGSLIAKLQGVQERYQEITALLSEASVIADQDRFRALSQEYSQVTAVADCFAQWQQAQADLKMAQILLGDLELREMAQQEIQQVKHQIESLERQLQYYLLPKDPKDDNHCFLEIRAGAGGSEAAIFAGDLLRLYSRYAEQRGWKLEVVTYSVSEQGGFKEVITKVCGGGAYGALKFESGGHRVQRVPITESQGRVHTSTCTVAVMPEVPELEVLQINQADLRVDTFRASGAGGQHINRTDSAIRITHLPTGTVVECQDERSQHKNRAKAMSVLAARLHAAAEAAQQRESAAMRRNLLGSGERSDRIRTYNFAQNRVTDHRINLTVYRLNELLEGQLDLLIQPLVQEDQADRLATLSELEI